MITVLEKLCQDFSDKGFILSDVPLRASIAVSFPEGYTALDTARVENTVEKTVILSHELGHHETGSFYNICSHADERIKHEYRADTWAVQYLLAPDALQDAISHGHTDTLDLAEFFNVTISFLLRAFDIYARKGFNFTYPNLENI
jgi:hypothetical protein